MSSARNAQYTDSEAASETDSRPLTPPEAAVSLNNASAALSSNVYHLARVLLYIIQLVLISVRKAPHAVANQFSAVGRHRDSRSALLPQYSSTDSEQEVSKMSSDEFRQAVITSFLNDSDERQPTNPGLMAHDYAAPNERTPLLDHTSLTHHSRKTKDLHIIIRDPSAPAMFDPWHEPNTIIPNPSSADTPTLVPRRSTSSHSPASSEDSASLSTPSSSNSSFILLRSALKKPSLASSPAFSPSPSTHTSPRLSFLRLALPDILIPNSTSSPSGSGRSTPKVVRFNPGGNETHFFEYAPNEEHDGSKPLRAVGGDSNAMGKWKKRGNTIIWQDQDRPDRHPRAAHSNPTEEEEDVAAILGHSLPGRILHSLLLLGSRTVAGGASGGERRGLTSAGGGTGNAWAEETRWRDGMF